MLEYAGKLVPETLSELVDPSHTALILIDLQNDTCSEGGSLVGWFGSIHSFKSMIEKIRTLLDAARVSGALVIHTQHTNLPEHRTQSARWIRFLVANSKQAHPSQVPLACLEGSWGQQILNEVKPLPNEIVVKKHEPSAFAFTDLDLILRNSGVITVVLAGVVSPGCVMMTATWASCLGYFVVVAEDCISASEREQELHQAALKLMKRDHDAVGSEDIITTWKGMKRKPE